MVMSTSVSISAGPSIGRAIARRAWVCVSAACPPRLPRGVEVHMRPSAASEKVAPGSL